MIRYLRWRTSFFYRWLRLRITGGVGAGKTVTIRQHTNAELCEFFMNELPRKFYDVRGEIQ